jgi:hypothetical protein
MNPDDLVRIEGIVMPATCPMGQSLAVLPVPALKVPVTEVHQAAIPVMNSKSWL